MTEEEKIEVVSQYTYGLKCRIAELEDLVNEMGLREAEMAKEAAQAANRIEELEAEVARVKKADMCTYASKNRYLRGENAELEDEIIRLKNTVKHLEMSLRRLDR